ncbi:hypothetical protein ABZ707_29815 [Streptomyces sp. NPDC006923]
MSEHVHVRLHHGVGVSEAGELVEHSRCLCGATWTRTYETDGPESE